MELKKSLVSDFTMGQVSRYMSYISDEIADNWQEVFGAIIGLDDDRKLVRAVSMIPSVDFYKYSIRFSLIKVLQVKSRA